MHNWKANASVVAKPGTKAISAKTRASRRKNGLSTKPTTRLTRAQTKRINMLHVCGWFEVIKAVTKAPFDQRSVLVEVIFSGCKTTKTKWAFVCCDQAIKQGSESS